MPSLSTPLQQATAQAHYDEGYYRACEAMLTARTDEARHALFERAHAKHLTSSRAQWSATKAGLDAIYPDPLPEARLLGERLS